MLWGQSYTDTKLPVGTAVECAKCHLSVPTWRYSTEETHHSQHQTEALQLPLLSHTPDAMESPSKTVHLHFPIYEKHMKYRDVHCSYEANLLKKGFNFCNGVMTIRLAFNKIINIEVSNVTADHWSCKPTIIHPAASMVYFSEYNYHAD